MSRYSTTCATLFAIVAAVVLSACSKKEAPPPPAPPPAAAPAPAAAPVAVKPPKPVTAPAPKVELAHAFTVGELSAVALRDGGIEVPNDNKVFGVGHTPEEVAAVLSEAGQPTDKLQLSIQPLLVKTRDKVLLFDTGAGASFGPGAGQLAASLAAANVDPDSITDIFISHVHGDHVGGLVNAKGVLAFQNATIHLSKPEWAYLSGMNADAALIAAIKPKLVAFAPGAELIPGIVTAVEIKGHTPGHSGYLITSGTDSLLYVGDSMHHFIISVEKPEWLDGFDADGKTAAASRAALISQVATNGQRIYAVHFPFPGIGRINGRGEGFVWVAE